MNQESFDIEIPVSGTRGEHSEVSTDHPMEPCVRSHRGQMLGVRYPGIYLSASPPYQFNP